jgi:hypothetical protein
MAPPDPPGTMIWTNLNLHCIRKLSCKYELFWFCGSRDPTLFLHFCDYLPLEKNLALLLNNLNSFHPRMICTKFDWNWPAGSGKDFFQYMVFPIVALSDPWGPWFVQTWLYIYIIPESFHVNMNSPSSVVLEKIFKWPHPILAFLWLYPLWGGPGP